MKTTMASSRIQERFDKQESAAKTKLKPASSHDGLRTIWQGFDGDAIPRTLSLYSIPALPKEFYFVVTGLLLLKPTWQCIFILELVNYS